MKNFLTVLTLAITAAFPTVGFAENSYESDPSYLAIDKVLDLKTIRPEVNVNLPRFLLKDAASELGDSMKDNKADFAELIKDIKLIRFVVIEANHTNRPALDKAMKKLQEQLEEKWTSIVTVPEDHVGIYAMGDKSGESVAGIALLVYDHNDAVIGNIVGRVSLGKVMKLASQMHGLPKDLIKKLQGMTDQTNSLSGTNPDDAAKPDKSTEASEPAAKEASPK